MGTPRRQAQPHGHGALAMPHGVAESFESYRQYRLAEENHLRPPEEILLCQLRSATSETDDEILSRLARYNDPASEQADAACQKRRRVQLHLLRQALRTLPRRTQAMIRAAAAKRKTHKELAEHYDLSRQRVHAIIHAAHRSLRDVILDKSAS